MPARSVSARPRRDRLIFANSELCANLYYACRFFAPDPFAWAEVGGKTAVLLSPLEVDRGRTQARVDEVHALSDWQKQAAKLSRSKKPPQPGRVLALWLGALGAKKDLEVPADFPLLLGRQLQEKGYHLHPLPEPFWPEREIKNRQEIELMRQALRITEAGMARGLEVLQASRITRAGGLRWRGQPLRSEDVRAEIDTAVMRAGGQPAHTIVAGGEQACDPHERGSGPLRAGELIILDIFPRDTVTGFYGDLTRTVVRGTARPGVQELWQTCLKGQELALKKIRPGRDGGELHQEVVDFFAQAGYPMEQVDGRWRGFFHGTGHGLGLEVHEHPRFASTRFREGQVLTVEPGLYWPGVGGVRHEDVVAVGSRGAEMLSDFPKPFEL